jgi:hypothetical protein
MATRVARSIPNGVHVAFIKTMRIRMLARPPTNATADAELDEVQLSDYHPDQIYDVSASVATLLMACGWARGEMRSSQRRKAPNLVIHDRRIETDRRRLGIQSGSEESEPRV